MLKIAGLSLQYPKGIPTIARGIGVFPDDKGDDLPFAMGVNNTTTRAMLIVHKLTLAAKRGEGCAFLGKVCRPGCCRGNRDEYRKDRGRRGLCSGAGRRPRPAGGPPRGVGLSRHDEIKS